MAVPDLSDRSSTGPPASSSRTGVLCACLAGLVLLAWGRVLWGRFQYDDYATILGDPATWELPALAERCAAGIRPLLRVSWFLTARLAGETPAAFLAGNLALHVVAVLLVFALVRRRLSEAGAFVAAALFAIQPANAEVIAYVSGRSTGMMAVFVLAALLAHERVVDRDRRTARGWRAAELALFAAAVLTKEVALVYPALAFAWDVCRAEPQRSRVHPARSFLGTLGLAAPMLLLLAARPRYRELLDWSLGLRGPWDSLVAGVRSVPVMVSLWARPWALGIEHANPPAGGLYTSFSVLLVLAAIAGAVLLRRRAPSVALALAFPLIALAPTQSLIARADLVSEKPLYLAWLGPALGAGALVDALVRRVRDAGGARWAAWTAARIAAVVLAVAMAWACTVRVAVWADAGRLWTEAVTRVPSSARAWTNLGVARMEAGRDREAIDAFRRALSLDPADRGARSSLAHLELVSGALLRPSTQEEAR